MTQTNIKTSGVRSGHASHALHDQIFRNCKNKLLRDEVDIVESDEKLLRPIRDEDLFFCVILENIVNLRRKVRNRRLVRSDDLYFFLEITVFLGKKVH